MKTTEIFIEQVIIGFFVVLIAALPFLPEILVDLAKVKRLPNFIGIAAGVVGGAYLLGILFDRLADSLLADLEQHHRLRYALFKRGAGLAFDPWPEERLRIGILRTGGAVVEYYDYLRSRMRLSRALAVFLPPLTFAGVLALIRPDPAPAQGAWLLAVVPVAYLLALIGCRNAPPKTYDLAAVRRYREARSAAAHDGSAARRRLAELQRIQQELTGLLNSVHDDLSPAAQLQMDRSIGEFARRLKDLRGDRQRSRVLTGDLVDDPGVRVALLVALLSLALALWAGSTIAIVAALTGPVLAALAGWTWWRVSETQMAYLADFDRYAGRQPAPAAPAG